MKVDELVNHIAKASISPDLLSKVDIADLLQRLSPSDPAEGADALSQLLVVAVAQSQLLTQQQQRLQRQHQVIRKQASEIEQAGATVDKQQKELSHQQKQLKKLIDNYVEFKGVTLERAKQQIQHQDETREKIYTTEQTLQEVLAEQSQILSELQASQQSVGEESDSALEEKIHFVDESLKNAIDEQDLALSDLQAYQENELRHLRDELDLVRSELLDDIEQAKDLTESWVAQSAEDAQFFENSLNESMTFLDNKLDSIAEASDARSDQLSAQIQSEVSPQIQREVSQQTQALEERLEQLKSRYDASEQNAQEKEDALTQKLDTVLQESNAAADSQNEQLQKLSEQLEQLEAQLSQAQGQTTTQKKQLGRVEQGLKKSVADISNTLNAHASFSKKLKASNQKELKALHLRADQQEEALSEATDSFDRRMQHLTMLAYGGIGVAVLTLIGLVWMSL